MNEPDIADEPWYMVIDWDQWDRICETITEHARQVLIREGFGDVHDSDRLAEFWETSIGFGDDIIELVWPSTTAPECGRELPPGADDCQKPSYEELARTSVEEFYEHFGAPLGEDQDALRSAFVEAFTEAVIFNIEKNGLEDSIDGEIPMSVIGAYFAHAFTPFLACAIFEQREDAA